MESKDRRKGIGEEKQFTSETDRENLRFASLIESH